MSENWPIYAVVAALIAVVGLLIRSDNEWQKFRAAHACRVVAHVSGDLINTFDAKGNVGIAMTPDKVGWLCDDGITYYR